MLTENGWVRAWRNHKPLTEAERRLAELAMENLPQFRWAQPIIELPQRSLADPSRYIGGRRYFRPIHLLLVCRAIGRALLIHGRYRLWCALESPAARRSVRP